MQETNQISWNRGFAWNIALKLLVEMELIQQLNKSFKTPRFTNSWLDFLKVH